MAERLSSLAFSHQLATPAVPAPTTPTAASHSGFNPRQVSFDVNTPEELAYVNEFLIALGRNVTGSNPASASASRHHSFGSADYRSHAATTGSTGSSSAAPQSPSTYFDSVGLTQLGLSTMPGISTGPGSSTSPFDYHYSTNSRHGSRSSSSDFGTSAGGGTGLYPSFSRHHPQINLSSSGTQTQSPTHTPQSASFHNFRSSHHAFRPTPPLSSSASPDSSMHFSGTPPEGISPPLSHARPTTVHIPAAPQGQSPKSNTSSMGSSHAENAAAFDLLRDHRRSLTGSFAGSNSFLGSSLSSSSSGAGVPQIAPIEYPVQRNMRTVVPLKSVPSEFRHVNKGKADELDAQERGKRVKAEDMSDEEMADVERAPLRPIEPKIRQTVQRGPPAKLPGSSASRHPTSLPTSSSFSSDVDSMFKSSDSLYPRLTAGDAQFRLPPLHGYSGSSSSRHQTSHTRSHSRKLGHTSTSSTRYVNHRAESPESPGSRTPSPRLSPPRGQTVLPSLRELDFGRPTDRDFDSDRDERYLTRGVSRIGLGSGTSSPSSSPAPHQISSEERRRHAELIKDLLVAINRDFVKKYGDPSRTKKSSSVMSASGARVRSPLAGPGVTGDDEDERARTPVQRDVEMVNI